jgi:hypothetical protein
MRYKVTDYSPANKREYWIALGLRDLELLLEEAKNAARHTPLSDKETRHRLKGIVKGLATALEEAQKLGDDGTRRKVSKPNV